MADSCAFVVFPGSRYGPTPEPPEFCENDCEPFSEFCAQHQAKEYE